jgi:hypothetical protein
MGQWALKKAGTPYAFGDLFRNIFSHVSADARKMFCSEALFLDEVVNGMIPGVALDSKGNAINVVTGKPVPAPRPGEFAQYGLNLPRIQIA